MYDIPVSDREIIKRVYVKLNEVNDNICTENDVVNREQEWQEWAEHEKQLFMNANKINDITNLGIGEEIGRKVSFLSAIKISILKDFFVIFS